MPVAVAITELGKSAFLASLDVQLDIYRQAMDASADDVPGRTAVMRRHASFPGLRALAAVDESSRGVVGFAYGFHGVAGQWWHDSVRDALVAAGGLVAARAWLDDCLEVAEVHVLPQFQARGIGRRLVLTLAAGRPERTAVLSTRDAATPARHLYRQLGFADVVTGYRFPGGGPAYAVMGAPLPLPAAAAGPAGG